MNPQPTQSRLSISVMSHPKRANEAHALARRLDRAAVVMDPAPGNNPNPLKTAIHAWRAADPDATHHLVVQDDVELTDGFLDRVMNGIALFPDSALAFYANWSSMNGAFVRMAACAGATWVEEAGTEYFPTLATLLPRRYVDDYVEYAGHYAAWWHEDDDFMREFLVSRDINAYVSVPCLVEHGDLDSVAGNEWHGTRRAPVFTSTPIHPIEYQALAHSIDFCPFMNLGRVQALVRATHDGRELRIRRPWTDMVAPFGLDAGDIRERFDRLVGDSMQLQKAVDDLGDMFTFATWLTAFLQGAVLRSGRVPVRLLAGSAVNTVEPAVIRAGLRTIAVGGSAWMHIPFPLLLTYSTETDELAEAGFASGRADD